MKNETSQTQTQTQTERLRFRALAAVADREAVAALLERCYQFLADNSHEAEEDAAELMAAIEKAIDLNEERS